MIQIDTIPRAADTTGRAQGAGAQYPEWVTLWLPPIGALFFGWVVGWLVYHVFVGAEQRSVKWLAGLLGVIGGGP